MDDNRGSGSGDAYMPDYPGGNIVDQLQLGSEDFDIDTWLASFDTFPSQVLDLHASQPPVANFDPNVYGSVGFAPNYTQFQPLAQVPEDDIGPQPSAEDFIPANGWLSLLDPFIDPVQQNSIFTEAQLQLPAPEVGDLPTLDESSTPSSIAQPTAAIPATSVILERYVKAHSEDESEAPFAAIERNIKRLDPMSPSFPPEQPSNPQDHDRTDTISTKSNVSNVSWQSRANCLQNLGPLAIDEPDSPAYYSTGVPSRAASICSLRSSSSLASEACSINTFSTANSTSSRAPSRRKRTMTNNHKPSRKSTKSDNRFFCTFCGTSFSTKSTWKRHEESIHLMLKTWTCSPNGVIVSMAPFAPHHTPNDDASTVQPHNYQTCWFCNIDRDSTSDIPFSFNDAAHPTTAHAAIPNHYVSMTSHALEQHCLAHQNARTCHENSPAEKTFIRFDHFVRHLRDAHGIDGLKMTFDGSENASDPLYGTFQVLPGPTRSRCGFCGETFTHWADRVHHLSHEFWWKHRRMDEWTGDWGFDEEWMRRLQDARLPERFAESTTPPSDNPHATTLPISPADKPLPAAAAAAIDRPTTPMALALFNAPSKSLSFMETLDQLHAMNVESGDLRESSRTGRFPCTVAGCHKAFCLRKDLQRHHRTIHAADKPEFLCPVPTCKRYIHGFTRKDNLKYHIMQLHIDRNAPCFGAMQKILKGL
ncbi:hypothetical protein Dda_4150 [Drechslerella dactyloides]|uniref:C2H2-type domain-containing protein n=1 Tax=Drechslerella dactyloides TaxID=74499 RepID=A0AAD6J1J4_DREDA|nr:hypothetical protein Dda_4150 [Drechslerella dactyloides]